METYFNGTTRRLLPPWNPNLEVVSEAVLGVDFQLPTLPGETTPGISQSAIELAEILEREHPLYTKKKRKWADAFNWYNGDENIIQYIHQHPRERLENYQRRQQRGYYWNYTDSIIGLIASFIYSKTITRSLSDRSSEQSKNLLDELEAFWKDIDRLGTNADEFFKSVLIYTQVFGTAYVMVDMPRMNNEENLLSESVRQELGMTPYSYIIPTMNLTNWSLHRDGRFQWARWFTEVDNSGGPFARQPQEELRRYTTWTESDWYVHDVITPRRGPKYAVLIDAGPNMIGEVPIVSFHGKKDLTDSGFGNSLGYTLGKINVAILNYLSLLDEDLYGKCLNLLAVQVDEVDNSDMAALGNAPGRKPIEIGANNVLTYTSMNKEPFYLAPSSEPGDLLMRHISSCIDQIYRIALFGSISAPKAPYSEKSGAAYGYEFQETNRMLSDKSYGMEKGEIEICRFWSKWMGLDRQGIGFIIDYPDEFHVKELALELKDILESEKIVTSSTLFTQEMQKRVVRRMIDHDFTDLIDRINAEIEENSVSPQEKQEEMFEQQQERMAAAQSNSQNQSEDGDTEEEE